ncbi:hypothetical protein VOM14_28560 [Paraburkholderia sp. MPAMCS5]|uniref:hypothetical protein n=1 Tax=Paraburkholderia sp. MPAMCS5 TaxID=3112563 RepID=UPI002E1813D7|nr:hypothetical protein [Paraburkholderia sp. MPAMCS5]
MADSAVSTQSRPGRAASKKRRQATVSTETEKKLARAARSAQRLAQLSDASRDDSTLDLFPDDPTRATLEAMNVDIRQGTLHGFELPNVVLAAVGALDAADVASPDAKAARRAPRAARADEPLGVNAQLSGLEMEPSVVCAAETGSDEAASKAAIGSEEKAAASPLTPALAAATVMRSVTALRQAAERGTSTTADAAASGKFAAATRRSEKSPQRSASSSTSTLAPMSALENETAVAVAEAGATSTGSEAISLDLVSASEIETETEAAPASAPASAEKAEPAGIQPISAPSRTSFAAPRHDTPRAEAAGASRATPELDRARATAFADTVDALYGVIADQRRAATDHSRRMKWMLSIVVGALLMTVAIGITQTVLLMRLTHETTAQQHRVEQMMQNQQAAMASLLDTQMAMANAAAAPVATPALAAPQQTGATPASANGKRAVRAQHAHKPKTANSY